MNHRTTVTLCLACLCLPAHTRADWTHVGPVEAVESGADGALLRCSNARIQVEAVTADTVRIRLLPAGLDAPASPWSVLTPAGQRSLPVTATDPQIEFAGGRLAVRVQRSPCRLGVVDTAGRTLLADAPTRGMAWGTGRPTGGINHAPVRAWHRLPDDTHVFGLGEKTGDFERTHQSWAMWNTDAYAYGTATDPLYVSVPFYLAERDGRWHGVYFDNPWRSSFDFGRLEPGQMSFGATGGVLDYYVFAGPTVKDVIEQYTALTGRMPLPPKWAIGYHQCRYSYFPEARVREIAATFRAKAIPCDVLWYDIDYMDGYRCFTWDPARFPDPSQLNNDLHKQGFHTVAILDPGIKVDTDYAAYNTGGALRGWLTEPDGQVYVGRVWPGDCVFPDFTAARVRAWWSDQVADFVTRSGLDGVWNDMNEPANFAGPNGTVPLDLVHDNNGSRAPHLACHNVYGMQMARATLDGLTRAYPDRRPFTLTRANFAGGQRYAATWTGDNRSTWDHLRLSIPMALGMGLSGMPLVGPDIGGFSPGASPELFARWIQVGALFPFARTHSSSPTPDQEPWSFGPAIETIARRAIERRYELLPYLYTLVEEATRTGTPIMRPVWMEIPEAGLDHPDWTFMLGPDLYVAPITDPSFSEPSIPLPPGVWYDANTGEIHGGPRWIKVDPALDVLPHFWRAGSIVPRQSAVQHTGMQADEPLIVDVWLADEGDSTLYTDAGDGVVRSSSDFRRTRFCLHRENDMVNLRMLTVDGTHTDPTHPPLVRFHGMHEPIKNVYLGAGLDYRVDRTLTPSADGSAAGLKCDDLRAERLWSATAVDDAIPTSSSTYHYDRAAGILQVRLESNYGQAQHVSLRVAAAQAPAERDRTPVVIDWARPERGVDSWRWTTRPIHRSGATELDVRGAGTPWIRLPRLAVDANALSHLELRLGVRHTRKLGLRFAAEHDPAKLFGEGVTIDLRPDGQVHDYPIDLRALFPDDWRGRIYLAELVFEEGSVPGERIRLERAAFTPAPLQQTPAPPE